MESIDYRKLMGIPIFCALIWGAGVHLRNRAIHQMNVDIIERAEKLIRPKGSLKIQSVSLRSGAAELLEHRPPFKARAWKIDIYRMKILKASNKKSPGAKPRLSN